MDLAPKEANGPYYWKLLKDGTVRYLSNKPKGKHIVEYLERIDWHGQDKMHYLNLIIGNQVFYQCDFRSVCGYDRGPKFNVFLKLMWEKV
jgi:hypothetical protein